MTAKENAYIRKLVKQTEKATKIVERNRFVIETLVSAHETKIGKIHSHNNASQLFAKLAI